jgi:hypothetical protein
MVLLLTDSFIKYLRIKMISIRYVLIVQFKLRPPRVEINSIPSELGIVIELGK